MCTGLVLMQRRGAGQGDLVGHLRAVSGEWT